MLIKYIRNYYGEKIGAIVSPMRGRVGVSMCNPKDRFDKELAVSLAAGRAITSERGSFYVPMRRDRDDLVYLLKFEIEHMGNRSMKYYQEGKTPCNTPACKCKKH